VIWITKKLSMYVFKKFPDGKLIGGKGASVRPIMTATVAITGPAGKSLKLRAGRAMSNHKTLFSTRHQQRRERRGTG